MDLVLNVQARIKGAGFSNVLLEQYIGKTEPVTKLDLVNEIAARIYGGAGANIDCGIINGAFWTRVFAYPDPATLSYRIGITRGQLYDLVIETIEVVENLSFMLTKEVQATYPVLQLIAKEPVGPCWGADGGVISLPKITVSGNKFLVPEPIYGTVRVTYTTVRHVRRVIIPAKDGYIEEPYQSLVWASWDGGVRLLTLKVPKKTHPSDANCAYEIHNSYIVNMPEDKIKPPDRKSVV